jgi:hypothetical protein
MRVLLVIAAIAACHPSPRPGEVASKHSDVWAAFAQHGLWIGKTATSPLGQIPYALAFTTDAKGVIVAETPPPPGGELPKGAYQRFTFDPADQRFTYKASLGDRFAEGSLVGQNAPHDQLVFCFAPGCGGDIKVVWRLVDATHLQFVTSLKGVVHSDIALVAQ